MENRYYAPCQNKNSPFKGCVADPDPGVSVGSGSDFSQGLDPDPNMESTPSGSATLLMDKVFSI